MRWLRYAKKLQQLLKAQTESAMDVCSREVESFVALNEMVTFAKEIEIRL